MTDAIQKVIDANPDDTCAKMLQVAVEALRNIDSVQGNEPQGREYWAERMNVEAHEALQKMNQMAEGGGDGN